MICEIKEKYNSNDCENENKRDQKIIILTVYPNT